MCAVLFQQDMYVVVESTNVIDLCNYYVFKSFLEITSKVQLVVLPHIALTIGQASKLQMRSNFRSDSECVQFDVKK